MRMMSAAAEKGVQAKGRKGEDGGNGTHRTPNLLDYWDLQQVGQRQYLGTSWQVGTRCGLTVFQASRQKESFDLSLRFPQFAQRFQVIEVGL